MELTNTKKWTKDKPQNVAALSIMLISLIDYIYSVFYFLKKNKLFSKAFQPHDMQTWESYYKNYNSDELFQAITELSDSNSALTSTTERKLIKLIQTGLQNNNKAILDEILSLHLNDTFNESQNLEDENIPYQTKIKKWEHILKEYPILAFTFKILLLCLFKYKTMPKTLFEMAVNKNIQAFEKLAKVDNTITKIPDLESTWKIISSDPSSRDLQRISKILSNDNTPHFKKSQIKYSISALIYILSGYLGHQLSRSQIRELLDFYARDKYHTMHDEELPLEEKSFSVGIKREIDRWKATYKLLTQDIIK